ncbi:pilus assembly protein PilP [Vibrio sinaloensis]|uniref:Fimbrial protein n=1 Tax=Photobacterium sp. (strain ATCC 43367) TaxID=379097 RepID=A0A0A5I4R1_PHOS4|nr:pilus assembly protein PilP [Vibrio sinaloensis]KGY10744.1 fimbrial protein [Vibrio sinaloensis]
MKNKLALLGLSLFLLGCQANEESLDEFVAQVERKARQDVVDLKPVFDFQISAYQSHNQREPFVLPQAALVLNQPLAKADCWQPVQRRKTGQLERFPLSKLRLKGVMGSGGRVSALVQTPEGNVVKVSSGQYIGLNNGKVTHVADDYLKINETLPDGLGCWNKRSVKLALK